LYSRRRLH